MLSRPKLDIPLLKRSKTSKFHDSSSHAIIVFQKISNKIWSSTTDIAVMAIVAVSYEREIQWVAVSYDSKPFWTWTGQKNLELWICLSLSLWITLKVSKFQNEFLKSSLLPKYEPNIVRISSLYCAIQGRNPYNFSFIFWKKWWLHKFILIFTDI